MKYLTFSPNILINPTTGDIRYYGDEGQVLFAPLFTTEFCNELNNELNNSNGNMLPLGYTKFFQELIQSDNVSKLLPEWFKVDNEGLIDCNAFLIHYSGDNGEYLEQHIDDSELTLNICLEKELSESDVAFFPSNNPLDSFLVSHRQGYCLIHRGDLKHHTMRVSNPNEERTNIIVWYRRQAPLNELPIITETVEMNKNNKVTMEKNIEENSEIVPVHLLSDDVLGNILSYLPVNQTIHCREVSHHWSKVINPSMISYNNLDMNLLKLQEVNDIGTILHWFPVNRVHTITFNNFQSNSIVHENLFNSYYSVDHLDFTNCYLLPYTTITGLIEKFNTTLRSIILKGCIQLIAQYLISVLSKCLLLQTLDMSGTSVVMTTITGLPKSLTVLDVSECSGVLQDSLLSDLTVLRVLRLGKKISYNSNIILNNHNSLERLRISIANSNDSNDIQDVVQSLSKLVDLELHDMNPELEQPLMDTAKHLQRLHLESNQPINLMFLSQCTQLRSLGITYPTDESDNLLQNTIEHAVNNINCKHIKLRELSLFGSLGLFDLENAKVLMQKLDATYLKYLDVSRTQVTSEALRYIGQNLPHLESLQLDSCLTLKSISLQDFPSLQSLSIRYCNLESLNFKSINNSLMLRVLYTYDTNLVKHLEQYYPSIKVHKRIRLFIQFLKKDRFSIYFDSNLTIADLRQCISSVCAIQNVESIQIIMSGYRFDGHESLLEYGVTDNSVIHCIIR
jgi:hypothetical protein